MQVLAGLEAGDGNRTSHSTDKEGEKVGRGKGDEKALLAGWAAPLLVP